MSINVSSLFEQTVSPIPTPQPPTPSYTLRHLTPLLHTTPPPSPAYTCRNIAPHLHTSTSHLYTPPPPHTQTHTHALPSPGKVPHMDAGLLRLSRTFEGWCCALQNADQWNTLLHIGQYFNMFHVLCQIQRTNRKLETTNHVCRRMAEKPAKLNAAERPKPIHKKPLFIVLCHKNDNAACQSSAWFESIYRKFDMQWKRKSQKQKTISLNQPGK